ncbi:hypothetical protein HY572_04705 [Candidatus Micrarchaeota archaeon]|nr:hypothetical protein [Candidatus Micrarchaeota archaeon]
MATPAFELRQEQHQIRFVVPHPRGHVTSWRRVFAEVLAHAVLATQEESITDAERVLWSHTLDHYFSSMTVRAKGPASHEIRVPRVVFRRSFRSPERMHDLLLDAAEALRNHGSVPRDASIQVVHSS